MVPQSCSLLPVTLATSMVLPTTMILPTTMVPPTTTPFQCQTHQSSRLICTCSNQLIISTTTHPFSRSITSWSNQGLLTKLCSKPTIQQLDQQELTTVHTHL